MKFYLGLCLTVVLLPLSTVGAVDRLATFDTAPLYELPLDSGLETTLAAGEWGVEEDGLDNNVGGFVTGPPTVPLWNSGGWLQPIGFETPATARPAIGPNPIGVNENAILAQLNTGVVVFDNTSWGDVSNATHVTMDVKGSFAGSGGITVIISHDSLITADANDVGSLQYWSWAAAASDVSVGFNPGDVTGFTTIQIPINKPDGGNPSGNNGTWGTFGANFTDAGWDELFLDINSIEIVGLTPDTEIDNLGFVIPDAGPGDFDGDTDVDGADFLEWQRDQTGRDLADWQTNYGNGTLTAALSAVPEPSSLVLAAAGLLALLGRRQVRS